MAHCEVFKSPDGRWYWLALWNDAPPQRSEDGYPTAEDAWQAAASLPLTIVYRNGIDALSPYPPDPDIHAG